MKISGGLSEEGVISGNVFDKYGSRNPIVRALMAGFQSSLSQFVEVAAPHSIHEVGCGEGYWANKWKSAGFDARGSDFSETVIQIAKRNAHDLGLSSDHLSVRSIYDLDPLCDSANLVVCCEVLEHLDDPATALRKLHSITERDIILSVPREPLWRILNVARGKYLSELGNTPGHIQNWSKTEFINLVGGFFSIKAVSSPVPWTMIHGQK